MQQPRNLIFSVIVLLKQITLRLEIWLWILLNVDVLIRLTKLLIRFIFNVTAVLLAIRPKVEEPMDLQIRIIQRIIVAFIMLHANASILQMQRQRSLIFCVTARLNLIIWLIKIWLLTLLNVLVLIWLTKQLDKFIYNAIVMYQLIKIKITTSQPLITQFVNASILQMLPLRNLICSVTALTQLIMLWQEMLLLIPLNVLYVLIKLIKQLDKSIYNVTAT